MTVGLLLGAVMGALAGGGVTAALHRRRERSVLEGLGGLDQQPVEGRGQLEGDFTKQVRGIAVGLAESTAEAELTVARLEQALDRMVDGVIVSDIDGIVVFTNTAGAAVAEARHEDSIVAAAATDCLGEAVKGAMSRRSVELFGPPARTITVEAHPLGDPDERIGAVASIVDESRLRRLEAVRSDFVANVSHELKTPIGGLALLAEALADADEDERERLAGRLHDEAHRVGRVIDDLLVLSEIESDRPPGRVRIELSELVDRVGAEVAILAERSGVEIDLDGVDPRLSLVGDPVLLTSALTNLVENAVKYSDGASPVRVWAEGDAELLRVGVTDRGLGIPRQDLDRVFERFYRVDRARSQSTGGTGLGLAIVRNVVRAHDGEVEVVSREGEGSTFTMLLPRAGGGAPVVSTAAAPRERP